MRLLVDFLKEMQQKILNELIFYRNINAFNYTFQKNGVMDKL